MAGLNLPSRLHPALTLPLAWFVVAAISGGCVAIREVGDFKKATQRDTYEAYEKYLRTYPGKRGRKDYTAAVTKRVLELFKERHIRSLEVRYLDFANPADAQRVRYSNDCASPKGAAYYHLNIEAPLVDAIKNKGYSVSAGEDIDRSRFGNGYKEMEYFKSYSWFLDPFYGSGYYLAEDYLKSLPSGDSDALFLFTIPDFTCTGRHSGGVRFMHFPGDGLTDDIYFVNFVFSVFDMRSKEKVFAAASGRESRENNYDEAMRNAPDTSRTYGRTERAFLWNFTESEADFVGRVLVELMAKLPPAAVDGQ